MKIIFSMDFLILMSFFLGLPLLSIIWKWKDFKYFFKKLNKFDIIFFIIHFAIVCGFIIAIIPDLKVTKIVSTWDKYFLGINVFIIIFSLLWYFSKTIDRQKMSFRNNGQDCRIIGSGLTILTITIEIVLFIFLRSILFLG